jgi:HlyD family secretion protein
MSNTSLEHSKLEAANRSKSLNRRLTAGLVMVALLVAAVGGWAANASLSGAVIAAGQVVVESSVKKIQHPTGGVVGEILVKSGDKVSAGDLLLRLDDTQTKATLGIVLTQLVDNLGRNARLAAERDGTTEVVFPEGFEQSSAEARRVATGESRLFTVKNKAAEGRRAQLRARIGQYRNEIAGLTKQEKAKSKELRLVNEELERLEKLYAKQLLPQTRVLAMQREATRIEGEHGALISQIARTEGQISETELQILEIDETRVADAQKELREGEARIAELQERRIAAEDTMKRVEMRAPQAGVVHELAMHTVGGVVGPGDTVMSIVPLDDQSSIEVRLQPTDIDQVTVGQAAVLRFPAFNQRSTPELNGKISLLASEVSKDQQTGVSYYTARISLENDELKKLGTKHLIAGMPVESYIQTGERTALSYLTKPFTDQVARAFKEE